MRNLIITPVPGVETTKCGVQLNIFAKTPQFLLPFIVVTPIKMQVDEKEEDLKVINVLEVLFSLF